jgi:predicted dehydrogenase
MCRGAFSYHNVDPQNMRNRPELGGGALPDIGVYPIVTTRLVTGGEPVRMQASVERDPTFGTDIYASVKADFGTFELSFYVSTQMAMRQTMVFHGDKGFIEVASPFNAGLYDHHRIELARPVARRDADLALSRRQPVPAAGRGLRARSQGEFSPVFTLEESVKNQKAIDAIFRAGEADGWV